VKKILLILTLLSFFAVVGAWVATGAHLGWTATQVEVMKVDPVTQLAYPVWEPKLVLGVDFLGLGLAGCALLGTITFFVSKKTTRS
jgi:hypothetical protein